MTYKDGNFSGVVRTPIIFLVESDKFGDRIHVDLHYSEDDLEEHSALRGADGALRGGIRSYPLISVDLENLSDHGFVAKKGNGKRHFELRTYVQMTGTSDKLEITIDVMEHYYHYPEERNGQPYSEDSVLWTFTKGLWNKSMSHFVRSVTGTTAPTVPVVPDVPDVPAAPQNSSTKRRAAASTRPGPRRTPQRATRKRAIDYAEDEDEDME